MITPARMRAAYTLDYLAACIALAYLLGAGLWQACGWYGVPIAVRAALHLTSAVVDPTDRPHHWWSRPTAHLLLGLGISALLVL